MKLSNQNAIALLLDLNQDTEEYADATVKYIFEKKNFDFLTYPPNNGLTDLEKAALSNLDNNEHLKNALRKILADDLHPNYIETIIRNIEDENDDEKSFRNSIIMGGFFLIGGLILNILSFNFSEHMGASSFILFWGIAVIGIITIIRGFILYRK